MFVCSDKPNHPEQIHDNPTPPTTRFSLPNESYIKTYFALVAKPLPHSPSNNIDLVTPVTSVSRKKLTFSHEDFFFNLLAGARRTSKQCIYDVEPKLQILSSTEGQGRIIFRLYTGNDKDHYSRGLPILSGIKR